MVPTVKKETKPPSLLQYLPKLRALFSLSWLGSFYSDVFYLVFLDRSSLCHHAPTLCCKHSSPLTHQSSLYNPGCWESSSAHVNKGSALGGNLPFRSFLHLYLWTRMLPRFQIYISNKPIYFSSISVMFKVEYSS